MSGWELIVLGMAAKLVLGSIALVTMLYMLRWQLGEWDSPYEMANAVYRAAWIAAVAWVIGAALRV